jgi:hypothetical protein
MSSSPGPRRSRPGRPATPPHGRSDPDSPTVPLPQQRRPPIVVQPPDVRDPPHSPRRKRGAVSLWVLGAVIVVVAGLWVSALGFVSPAWFVRTVFDPGGVQLGVQQVLRDSYHVDGVESVTCPPGEPVQPAVTFACKVRVGDRTQTVPIAVQDANGTYHVGRPR